MFSRNFPSSRYKHVCTIGRSSGENGGITLDGAVSRLTYGFGIKNENRATARQVRAEMINGGYKDGVIDQVKIPLEHGKTARKTINIQSGVEEVFILVEFFSLSVEHSYALVGYIDAADESKLEDFRFFAAANMMSFLPQRINNSVQYGSYPAGLPPVPGHEVVLDVAIYADDLPPTFARFMMRRAERVTLHLVAQGLKLPRVPDFRSPSRAGIARRILRRVGFG